eukprot:1719232-Pleurochrysis_carterae.AAC.2
MRGDGEIGRNLARFSSSKVGVGRHSRIKSRSGADMQIRTLARGRKHASRERFFEEQSASLESRSVRADMGCAGACGWEGLTAAKKQSTACGTSRKSAKQRT